jgi:phasin family protein
MTSFTEQLSAVRQSQLDAQLDMFRQLSGRALDSTEQLIALNMKASRASMEQAAGAVKHLLEAKDPRDLFALGSAAQGQWHQLFDYSRELLGIATGMRGDWSTLSQAALPAPLRLIAAPTANMPTTPGQIAEQAAIATADAFTMNGEIGAAAAEASAAATPAAAEFEKTVDSAIADDVPPARATPLASALNEAAPKPASVDHPIVSTVPLEASGELELPAVAPVEHTPPAPAPAPAPQARPARGSRKK